MAVSYVEQAPLTCPECGHEFTAEVRLIRGCPHITGIRGGNG